jgi:hypothetical protein
MLKFNQIKTIIKESFESINITLTSSNQIEIFDPKSPNVKIIGEKNKNQIDFFEIIEKEEPGFEQNQKSFEFDFLGNSNEIRMEDLISLV